MLDSHNELAIPPESYFVATFARQHSQYELGQGFDENAFVESLCSIAGLFGGVSHDADVRRTIHQSRPADTADAIRAVFRLYSLSQGQFSVREQDARECL